MVKRATPKRPKKPKPAPGSPRHFGWCELVRTLKFCGTAIAGFLSGYGGLFLTSDNASRLISMHGIWASVGLIVLGICKICYEYKNDNTACASQSSATPSNP